MEETIRIRTNINGVTDQSDSDYTNHDRYINVQLDQKFDFLEILSLRISQEDVYRKFCADYGVVVGRIIVNGGFGVPNANVSIFIPIADIEIDDYLKVGLYPYQTIVDKDIDGIRYNLLTKKRQNACHFPVGSFPNKREFLDNDVLLEIYEDYYKFTTTTNEAGDYMLFGVPTGAHTIHIDVDISDIGIATRRPYDMIRDGNPEKMFDTPTKYKNDRDLNQLRQIIKGQIGVEVVPFWGDSECSVGINRVDYDLPIRVETTSFFFGGVMTDKDKHSLNRSCRPRWALGEINEMTTGAGQIEMIRKTITGEVEYKMIDGGRLIDEDGTFAYQVPMNLSPMVTDEFGNLVPSDDPRKGLMSEADVRFRIKMDVTGGEGRIRETAEYLVPHNPDSIDDIDYNFDATTGDDHFFNMRWNKVYTVRNFIPRFQANLNWGADNEAFIGIKEVDRGDGKVEFPFSRIDTDYNFLFAIIMLILRIVGWIVYLLNAFVLPVINLLIVLLNWIIDIINSIISTVVGWICDLISWWNGAIGGICMWDWCPLSGLAFPPMSICPADESIFPPIPYTQCITMECSGAESSGSDCGGNNAEITWAPGCECCDCCGGVGADEHCTGLDASGTQNPGNDGECLLNMHGDAWDDDNSDYTEDCNPVYWTGVAADTIIADLDQYLACVGSVLAEKLDMYNLNFHSDWINGTLYHILYKNKRNGYFREFCDADYTCDNDAFGGFFCMESYLVDVLVDPWDSDDDDDEYETYLGNAEKSVESRVTNSGVIKKYFDHYYYAPFILGHKLYATDITVLGAVEECDVDGFPKLIDRIGPTSYIKGPTFDTTKIVCDESTGDEVILTMETGIIGYDEKPGLFMNVDWSGLWVNYCQGRSVKLQAELGRTTDEMLPPTTTTSTTQVSPNRIIGVLGRTHWNEFNSSSGARCGIDQIPSLEGPLALEDPSNNGPETQNIYDEYARYCLRGLNTPYAIANSTFDFITANEMYEPGSSYEAHHLFRGFNGDHFGAGDGEWSYGYGTPTNQPTIKGLPMNNSYYFYFGLYPGKTAIDKLKRRYLTDCTYVAENDFILDGVITNATTTGGVGGIVVTVLGGTAPYEYIFLHPDGTEIYVASESSDVFTFSSLLVGVYSITVNDATGGSALGVYEITGPSEVAVGASPTHPVTFGGGDGSIIINSLGGGDNPSGNYSVSISGPSSANASVLAIDLPYVFEYLVAGNYVVTVTNGSSSNSVTIILTDPLPMVIHINYVDIPCHDGVGVIEINQLLGGISPISVSLVGPSYSSTAFYNGGLDPGTYTLTVVDDNNGTPNEVYINGASSSNIPPFVIANPPALALNITNELVKLRKYGDTNGVMSGTFGLTPGNQCTLYRNGVVTNTPSASSSSGTFSHGSLPIGGYFYELKNENDCSVSANGSVVQPNPLTIEIVSHVDEKCSGDNDGEITINFGGGTPSHPDYSGQNYEIKVFRDTILYTTSTPTPSGEATFTYLEGGTYKFELRDTFGGDVNGSNMVSATQQLPIVPPISLSFIGATDSSITVMGNGGNSSAYLYSIYDNSNWSPYTSSNVFTGLDELTPYDIKVMCYGTTSYDSNCVDSETFSTLETP